MDTAQDDQGLQKRSSRALCREAEIEGDERQTEKMMGR